MASNENTEMSNQPINDGGPAFPTMDPNEHYRLMGMTLRDYFAAAALQGNLAGQSIDVGYYEGKDAWNKAAKDAYAVADAMLKAREGK
jgi:hypothetical protein